MPVEMTRGNARPRKGFTLVEILVVIGIIGVLIAILLPALNSARRSARTLQCASAMRQFGMAQSNYASSQNGWCVPIRTKDGVNLDGTLWGTLTYHPWYMNPIFRKHLNVAFPPIKKSGGASYTTLDWQLYWPVGLLCPEAIWSVDIEQQYISHCYGFNIETLGRKPNGVVDAKAMGYPLKLSQVRRPAEKIQMLDGNWFYLQGVASGSHADYRPPNGYDKIGETFPLSGSPITVNYRHKKGANVLFYDGHVSWMRKEEVFTYAPAPINGNLHKNLWNILDK